MANVSTTWRRGRQAHEDLVAYWRSAKGADGARVITTMLLGQHALEAMEEVLHRTKAEVDADMIDLALRVWEIVRDAPTWIVEPDMVQVVEAAAESMPSETMLRSDVPTTTGFLWLAEPTWERSTDGLTEIPLRAFHWNVHREDQVDVVVYRDRDDLGRGTIAEPPLLPEHRHTVPQLWPCTAFTWRFGEDAWPDSLGAAVNGSDVRARFLKALWTISQQTIASTTTPALPRGERRRAERLDMPSDVVLVQLRRAKRPTHDDTAVESPDWTHRWMVSGHWRNQYLPSTGGHRLQWIPEHVKGPDDKPLVVKPRVFDVRR